MYICLTRTSYNFSVIKKTLPLILLVCISVSASAQFWKKAPVVRPADIAKPKCISFNFTPVLKPVKHIAPLVLPPDQYTMDLHEKAIMHGLYHTLRFHMAAESVAGFKELVNLYLQESRFSEAKWYLLQSNAISRQQNDDAGIISSMEALGMVKAEIGDYTQAKQDLLDARMLAVVKNRLTDVADIDKKLVLIETRRMLNSKSEIKYAELAESKKG
jgi:hypothetical protein